MTGAPDHRGCAAAGAAARLFEIRSPTSPARSVLLRCDACGSLFPEAFPASPEPERRYDMGPGRRAVWRRVARRLADLTRGRYADRATPPGARRILDFGCGAGGYLARVAVGGREAFGVDLIEPAHGAAAWRWIPLDALERWAPYDWITLGHVFEHLDDPERVLSRLTAVLAPGGGLWIATPNADSFIFASAGGSARDVDYPRHREIFARAGLERLLGAAGLSVAWESPPRVNALLNVATTAGQIDGPAPVRLWLALAAHLLKPRRARDAESPELIAQCRLSPVDRSPAR